MCLTDYHLECMLWLTLTLSTDACTQYENRMATFFAANDKNELNKEYKERKKSEWEKTT